MLSLKQTQGPRRQAGVFFIGSAKKINGKMQQKGKNDALCSLIDESKPLS